MSPGKWQPFCLGLNVLTYFSSHAIVIQLLVVFHVCSLDLFNDNFRCIFVNEKFCILIEISLKQVPKGPTDNNPEMV